jgi:hypothetical protein
VRYMMLFYVTDRPEPGGPESEAARDAMKVFRNECAARGVLLAADPLRRPETATTIRVRDGQALSTDGPFAETTEWLGGYFIVDCADLDEALGLAARCPTATNGAVEVRPIMEVS